MENSSLNQDIKVKDILHITGGKLLIGNEEEICIGFCRDSRQIKEGDIYLGIKGESINGSIYYQEAFQKGAKGAILQDIEIPKEELQNYPNQFIILVKNTVQAMQQIATYKRNLYDIPVIAITGSVGKTSTKDMVASVVSQKYHTLKTKGNYNNHIGVPLTIFELQNQEAMVVEMGMNHLGEISTLTKIAKPTVAVITNIGTAHIGNLGSRENILKAKLEIIEGLDSDGFVVINNDNDLLHKWYLENKENYHIITYGIENHSDYMAEEITQMPEGSSYILKPSNQKIEVKVGGTHFILNSLCAIAVGSIFNIPIQTIAEGIANFQLTEKRMDITTLKDNITLIKDYYNANYDSMKAALEYLGSLQGKRKIAVLGDMLELGTFSQELHQKVGEEVVKNNIDILITVGKEAKQIAQVAQGHSKEIIICHSNQEAIQKINEIKQKNDSILLKASNGMHFEEIAEGIQKEEKQ